MQFIDNLYFIKYQIIDKENNKATFGIRFNAENVIYKAHFPSKPVTPGVCLIQIAQELLARCTGVFCNLKKVKNIKFTTLLDPITSPEIAVSLNGIVATNKDEHKVSVVFKKDEIIFSKMSLIFNTVS
ncbi:MAG: hypothetical protein Q4A56_06540 [Porphyromonadaceae bacterium]|nr:hypothetical protein [Porphyromonadaceae bacterium]